MKVESGKSYHNGRLPSHGHYSERYVESISVDEKYIRWRSVSRGAVVTDYGPTRYTKREVFEKWAVGQVQI
jgi:hypothetical protein